MISCPYTWKDTLNDKTLATYVIWQTCSHPNQQMNRFTACVIFTGPNVLDACDVEGEQQCQQTKAKVKINSNFAIAYLIQYNNCDPAKSDTVQSTKLYLHTRAHMQHKCCHVCKPYHDIWSSPSLSVMKHSVMRLSSVSVCLCLCLCATVTHLVVPVGNVRWN